MSTSCGRGFGTGRSWSFSVDGGPKRSMAAACIVAGMDVRRCNWMFVNVTAGMEFLPKTASGHITGQSG
ncbi:MAG: hypothetical protein ACREXP_20780 [Steroidobacteraceae bacterium]